MTDRTRFRRAMWAVVVIVWLAVGAMFALRPGRPPAAAPAATRAPIDWTRLTPSDMEVAAAFATAGTGDLENALATLRRVAATDSAVLRDAHEIAHALGRFALVHGGADPSIVARCTDEFAAGCYHGVIEAWVETTHHPDTDRLHELCTAARSADRPASEYDCVHGLGHGLAGITGHDLDAALARCDALDAALRYPCHSGVFMEVINRAVGSPAGSSLAHEHGAGTNALVLRDDDPYYPCSEVAARYRSACWPYQSFVIMRRNGFDFAATLGTCDAAPGDAARLCYESFGMQIAGLFQQSDAWILARCGRGSERLAPLCIEGAAWTLTGIDGTGERPLRFCATAPGPSRAGCFRRVGGHLRIQHSDPPTLERICDGAGPVHAADCRAGARIS